MCKERYKYSTDGQIQQARRKAASNMDSENTLRARIKVLEYVEFKAAASPASCSVHLFVDFLATNDE